MPEPGPELVREIIDALNRADVEGILARLHPDFEWRALEGSPVGGTYTGSDEVRRYVEDWLSTFADVRVQVDEMTQVGDAVLVVVHVRARGRGSGIEVDNLFCQLWRLGDDSAVGMQEYETREEALAQIEP